jgi:predicted metal-dependent hydrolase
MIVAIESQATAITPATFRREVRRWSKRIAVDAREIRVRAMKRKLASASSQGRLTFDISLLAASADHRAEIIVHELVHLKVGNHGRLFRSLVRAYLAEAAGAR